MRAAAALFVLLASSGCIGLSLQRTPSANDEIQVSPPGEDGSRYVAVRTGRRTAPQTLKRKWARVANDACEGDYILMSDGQSEQRRAGIVMARTHEGFVRCLMPSQSEANEQLEDHANKTAARR